MAAKKKQPFLRTQVISNPLPGLQIIAATDELFNHVDDNQPMWAGEGDRFVDVQVKFDRPFRSPPAVQIGVSGIDCDHEVNLRFNR